MVARRSCNNWRREMTARAVPSSGAEDGPPSRATTRTFFRDAAYARATRHARAVSGGACLDGGLMGCLSEADWLREAAYPSRRFGLDTWLRIYAPQPHKPGSDPYRSRVPRTPKGCYNRLGGPLGLATPNTKGILTARRNAASSRSKYAMIEAALPGVDHLCSGSTIQVSIGGFRDSFYGGSRQRFSSGASRLNSSSISTATRMREKRPSVTWIWPPQPCCAAVEVGSKNAGRKYHPEFPRRSSQPHTARVTSATISSTVWSYRPSDSSVPSNRTRGIATCPNSGCWRRSTLAAPSRRNTASAADPIGRRRPPR